MSINKGFFIANSSRYRLLGEMQAFARMVPAGSAVLDAGAGNAPYKSLFAHADYHCTDFLKADKEYIFPTYVSDLGHIPIADDSYDYILFTQVMEHLPEPSEVLTELFRILKPGGKLLFTAPFFFQEHEIPYDFYRYTRYGLSYLFTKAGFTIGRLDWLEGYFGTIAYQYDSMAQALPWRLKMFNNKCLGVLVSPFFLFSRVFNKLSSFFFHTLEKIEKYQQGGYPKNYLAILSK